MSPWRSKAIELADTIILNNNINKVFEVGCDDAGISINLAKKYSKIQFDGIDIRKNEIESANNKKNTENIQNAKFDYGYFLDITDTEQKYDIIIFTEVYEHLVAENQIYSLRLLGNLLTENGFLIFTSPNGDYLFSYIENKKTFEERYDENFFDDMNQTNHWLEPTHKEIKKIFVSLGFDIVKSNFFNLPKRQYKFIEKLEGVFNKIPLFKKYLFKSQVIVAQKNRKSPLLSRLNLR